MSKEQNGTICWHDLITLNPTASKKFLRDAFGITTQSWEDAPSPYEMLMSEGGHLGGIMQCDAKQGMKPMWSLYVDVAKIEPAATLVTKHGGNSFPAVELPNGRFAACVDPTGASFCLWESKPRPEEKDKEKEKEKEKGKGKGDPWVSMWPWHELSVKEGQKDKALAFYKSVFNWDASKDDNGSSEGTPYYTFRHAATGAETGGMYVMGQQQQQGEAAATPEWLCYLRVPDAAKAVADNTRLGGKSIKDATPLPHGVFAVLRDPQGIRYGVLQEKGMQKGKQEKEEGKGQKRKAEGEVEGEGAGAGIGTPAARPGAAATASPSKAAASASGGAGNGNKRAKTD